MYGLKLDEDLHHYSTMPEENNDVQVTTSICNKYGNKHSVNRHKLIPSYLQCDDLGQCSLEQLARFAFD